MRPLDQFLDLAASAITAAAAGPAQAAALRVAELLRTPPTPAAPFPATRLPVCDWLDTAYATTRPDLARAFQALEPELPWRTRPITSPDPRFATSHASARILDPNGLEQRGGLICGFSLVAPGVTYPEHNHPPEEIYLALSGGEWWQAGAGWHAPGPGGIVHNTPGIGHAMRGTDVPLLAIWFLLPT
jgi:quercetin dioxygenase-like cupin family protein